MPDVIVVGGAVAGLATALFAARAGSSVLLLEGDAHPAPPDVQHSLNAWNRPGVPQLGQGHSIHGLARSTLMECAPDVLRDLLAVGVVERRFLPMDTDATHEDVAALQVRRSVFEWVLRAAVEREPNVELQLGAHVTGLAPAAHGQGARGVVLGEREIVEAPWVVDASGRRSALPRWLAALGAPAPAEHSQDSAKQCYARHFRLRPGRPTPSGNWWFGAHGDLGFMRYSLLVEDAGHFVVTLNAPPSDQELRCLREDALWLRAARTFDPLEEWLSAADPASGVFTMGGLRNRLRDFSAAGAEPIAGVIPIGDALCQTNPAHGWGVSIALHQARMVARALPEAADRPAATRALLRRLTEYVRPYYAVAAGEDAERARIAAGAPPDWQRPGNPLFGRKVMFPLATQDPVIYRAVQRHIHLIDRPDRLGSDPGLAERALRLGGALPQAPADDSPGISRPALLDALGVGGTGATTRGLALQSGP